MGGNIVEAIVHGAYIFPWIYFVLISNSKYPEDLKYGKLCFYTH